MYFWAVHPSVHAWSSLWAFLTDRLWSFTEFTTQIQLETKTNCGVTRVGVSRGGNWPVPPFFLKKNLATFFSHRPLQSDDLFSCLVRIPTFWRRFSSVLSKFSQFLANVNSSSCSLYVIDGPSVCLSVVCNVRAPYSDDWNFRQYFYAMWYLGHPWSLYKNFTEIVPGEPLCRGS